MSIEFKFSGRRWRLAAEGSPSGPHPLATGADPVPGLASSTAPRGPCPKSASPFSQTFWRSGGDPRARVPLVGQHLGSLWVSLKACRKSTKNGVVKARQRQQQQKSLPARSS